MLKISKEANTNYLAEVVRIEELRKHENADRLQVATIHFQNVIVGADTKDSSVNIFFPVESQINAKLLAHLNAFKENTQNADTSKTGFFEKNCRVRAVKLRGEKSMGYLIPASDLCSFLGIDINSLDEYVGTQFDTIKDVLVLKKYVIKTGEKGLGKRLGKKPRVSRLVDGQVRLHVDTENLRKMIGNIQPNDHISVTYKYHGTSFWVGNVLVKRKLFFWDKIFHHFFPIETKEYDYVYGSRRVVKNEYETSWKQDFYDGSLWENIKDELKASIPKGYTVYGEAIGYTESGAEIQKGYDYGCEPGQKKILIYRVTFTNFDGIVFNLSNDQATEFCKHFGLNFVHQYYSGRAKDMFKDIRPTKDPRNWQRKFIERLQKDYNDKNCWVCRNEVPEEGIVIRKERFGEFEAYKLKSYAFLEYETKLLDDGVNDIESEN